MSIVRTRRGGSASSSGRVAAARPAFHNSNSFPAVGPRWVSAAARPVAGVGSFSLAFPLAAFVALGFVTPRVGRLATPGMALIVGIAYCALLAVTGEIGPAELAALSALRGKPGANGRAP